MRGYNTLVKRILMWGSMTLPKKAAFLLSALLVAGLTTAGAQQLKTRPQYQIQPGDVMEVHYRYTPEYDQTVTVQPDGSCAVANKVCYGAHDIPEELPDSSSI